MRPIALQLSQRTSMNALLVLGLVSIVGVQILLHALMVPGDCGDDSGGGQEKASSDARASDILSIDRSQMLQMHAELEVLKETVALAELKAKQVENLKAFHKLGARDVVGSSDTDDEIDGPPPDYKDILKRRPLPKVVYDFKPFLDECPNQSERHSDGTYFVDGALEDALENKCKNPQSPGKFVCGAQCSANDAELDKVFRTLRMDKYSLHSVLRLCKHGVFPFVVRIRENRIYIAKCTSKPTGRRTFANAMTLLLAITCTVRVPDVVFGFDGNDYAVPEQKSPLRYPSNGYLHPLPGVIRFVGMPAHATALFPTPPAAEATGLSLRTERPKINREQQQRMPWADRYDTILWRGSSTGMPFDYDYMYFAQRLGLCRAAKNLDGYDVGMITTEGVSQEMKEKGVFEQVPFLDRVSSRTYYKYRYLLHTDGNTASWGLLHKLKLDALILWHESTAGFREHYYHLFKPWEHYVPVEPDFSNLEQIHEWIHTDQGQVEVAAIRQRLRQVVEEKLRPEDTLCYVLRLVNSMAEAQDFDASDDQAFQDMASAKFNIENLKLFRGDQQAHGE